MKLTFKRHKTTGDNRNKRTKRNSTFRRAAVLGLSLTLLSGCGLFGKKVELEPKKRATICNLNNGLTRLQSGKEVSFKGSKIRVLEVNYRIHPAKITYMINGRKTWIRLGERFALNKEKTQFGVFVSAEPETLFIAGPHDGKRRHTLELCIAKSR